MDEDAAPTELRFELTATERTAAVAQAQRLLAKDLRGRTPWIYLGLVALAVFLALLASHRYGAWTGEATPWLLVIVAVAGVLTHQQRRAVRAAAMRVDPTLHLHLDDERLLVATPHTRASVEWRAVQGVERHGELIFVALRNLHVLPIPVRVLPSEDAARALVERLRARAGLQLQDGTASAAAATAAAPPVARVTARSTITRLLGNLRAGIGLLALRAGATDALSASLPQFLLLVALQVAVVALIDLAFARGEGSFAWFGLPWYAMGLAALLAAAWLASYVVGRPEATVRVIVAAAAIAVPLTTALALGERWLGLGDDMRPLWRWFTWAYWIAPAWLTLGATQVLRRLDSERAAAPGALWLAGLLLFVGATQFQGRVPSLWTPTDDTQDSAAAYESTLGAVAGEAALYRQAPALQAAIDAVAPARNGRPDLFYVGFAGYGSQDVFAREVTEVARLMAERFGADGRTLVLANDRKAPLIHPFATMTALRQALAAVAARMDAEEDVLLLFLTSHGGRDHKFSVELWPYRFDALTPDVLRQALDEAGIRNRVIVVSACYAGGFVEPLKTAHSLVITAARGDRRSFGCADGAEWTWFGRAYFDEALRQTHSFTEAFSLASRAVAAREAEGKETPSEPQMHVGESIGPVLDALERAIVARKPASKQ